jgi:hypothetical protein
MDPVAVTEGLTSFNSGPEAAFPAAIDVNEAVLFDAAGNSSTLAEVIGKISSRGTRRLILVLGRNLL